LFGRILLVLDEWIKVERGQGFQQKAVEF